MNFVRQFSQKHDCPRQDPKVRPRDFNLHLFEAFPGNFVVLSSFGATPANQNNGTYGGMPETAPNALTHTHTAIYLV